MATKKQTTPGSSDVVSVRFSHETSSFYRKRAQEAGVSLSTYIQKTLTAGVMAESVQTVNQRMNSVADKINMTVEALREPGLPDEAWKSLFMIESLLTVIVESRNPQDLYDAQEKANKRVQQMKALKGN